jgi:hypothetical protein
MVRNSPASQTIYDTKPPLGTPGGHGCNRREEGSELGRHAHALATLSGAAESVDRVSNWFLASSGLGSTVQGAG